MSSPGDSGDKDAGDKAPKKSSLSPSMKKTLVAVGAAGILAISGVLMLVSYVQSAEDSAAVADSVITQPVVVAASTIPSGTTLEDLGNENFSRFRIAEVPVELIPEGAIRTIEELQVISDSEDLMLDVNLAGGETLLRARFVPTESFSARSVVVDVPEGHHQASFRIAPDRVLGGLIRPGDDVSISSTFSSADGYPNLAVIVLTSVEVINVQIEGGVPEVEPPAEGEEIATVSRSDVTAAPTSLYLVTVAVTAEELAKLHYAIDYGRLLIAAATDHPEADVSAVENLAGIISDAGGALDTETGDFIITPLERPEVPAEQLAFAESGTDGTEAAPGAEGDPVNPLRSPSDVFGSEDSASGEG